MTSCALVDLSYDEMLEVDGGDIGSAELKLAAGICLCTVSPAAAAGLLVLSYVNTKFIENCIEY